MMYILPTQKDAASNPGASRRGLTLIRMASSTSMTCSGSTDGKCKRLEFRAFERARRLFEHSPARSTAFSDYGCGVSVALKRPHIHTDVVDVPAAGASLFPMENPGSGGTRSSREGNSDWRPYVRVNNLPTIGSTERLDAKPGLLAACRSHVSCQCICRVRGQAGDNLLEIRVRAGHRAGVGAAVVNS